MTIMLVGTHTTGHPSFDGEKLVRSLGQLQFLPPLCSLSMEPTTKTNVDM